MFVCSLNNADLAICVIKEKVSQNQSYLSSLGVFVQQIAKESFTKANKDVSTFVIYAAGRICLENIRKCDWYIHNVLLLTSCEVHWQNIRTTVLTYVPNEMRFVQKTKARIFFVWNEQLVNESFIV